MKFIVTRPKFMLYEYIPQCQHQKDVAGRREKGRLIQTELEAIFREILQNITAHIQKVKVSPNLTILKFCILPVTNYEAAGMLLNCQ